MEKNSNLAPQICSIHFAEVSDVFQINDGSDAYHKAVVFNTGKNWEEIYTAPATKDFSEEQKEVAAGPYFEQKVSLIYPGEDVTTRADFDNFGNKRFIIKLVFHSGIKKIMGDKLNPVKASQKFEIKTGASAVTFVCQATQKLFNLD